MTSSHGLTSAEDAAVADQAGEGLDGDVGDAEEDAGRGAEHDAVVLDRGADARAEDEQAADAEQAGLEGDHRRRSRSSSARRGRRAA